MTKSLQLTIALMLLSLPVFAQWTPYKGVERKIIKSDTTYRVASKPKVKPTKIEFKRIDTSSVLIASLKNDTLTIHSDHFEFESWFNKQKVKPFFKYIIFTQGFLRTYTTPIEGLMLTPNKSN